LILERYLPAPHHVEVQLMADDFGNVIHLGERDCSLQRRHQKILEETPSPSVTASLRDQLTSAAVALARHVGYRNAGTCEFLVEDGGSSGGAAPRVFGFIEMNARLQVEHPVTEMVTGLDLVELQLRVAMGEPLPLTQAEVTPTGHAVEVRLYAEDPDAGFLPQSGTLLHLRWPDEARVDSGVDEGPAVAPAGAAEAARLLAGARRAGPDPWASAGPWRHLEPGPTHVVLQVGDDTTESSAVAKGEHLVDVRGTGPFRVGETVLVQAD